MRLQWISRNDLAADLAAVERSVNNIWDRLNELESENERLVTALERSRQRYESLVDRMLEMKRDGFARPGPGQPVALPVVAPLPAVIQGALDNTFPGDKQIYAANLTYALSQRHRWDREAVEVAEEIQNGR